MSRKLLGYVMSPISAPGILHLSRRARTGYRVPAVLWAVWWCVASGDVCPTRNATRGLQNLKFWARASQLMFRYEFSLRFAMSELLTHVFPSKSRITTCLSYGHEWQFRKVFVALNVPKQIIYETRFSTPTHLEDDHIDRPTPTRYLPLLVAKSSRRDS